MVVILLLGEEKTSGRKRAGLVFSVWVIVFLSLFVQLGFGVKGTLIQNLTTLVDQKINWSESNIYVKLTAYSFGKISKTELADWIESLNDWKEVLGYYTMTKRHGIEDKTKIKWALGNATIMANGLPKSTTYGGKDAFSVYHRWLLPGYYYAEKYNYQLSKWNKTKAYDNFKWAIEHSTYRAALCVYSDNTTYTISYGPRFYDEAAQTIDVFLNFYQLGITEALNEAVNTWNWVNNNLWVTSPEHYKYALNWINWECESGGFLQIALKLRHYAPNTANIARVTTDMVNRYIAQRWQSPQWSIGSNLYYAVVHHNPANSERRMQNTLMAWSSIYGNYYNLATAERSNVTDLIRGYGGYDPAWKLLYNASAGLYSEASGLFRRSSIRSDSNLGTTEAASLLRLFGIVQDTGSIAMPLSEWVYEDDTNIMDNDLFRMEISNRKLRIGIQNPGVIKFQYGSTLTSYNFTQKGLYDLVFASDWNSITSVTRQADLPINRIYFSVLPHTIDNYDGLWHTDDFTITLTATDILSGVAETYYRINDSPTQNVTAHGQPLITTEGANKLEYWSVDNAGNEELPHKILTGIKLDKTTPTGSIVVNNGDAYTTSTSVTLTLTANDATSGVYQVRFSNDGAWDTEPWEASSPTKAWTLTVGDGTKTVHYQIKDNAGLISTTYSDTIMLDTTPPTGSISINDGATYTTTVTLTLSATDATSGVAEMRLSNDNIAWKPWEPYSTSKAWTLTANDGTKTVYTQFMDNAGLTSPIYQDTITLDATFPTANAGPDRTVLRGATVSFDAGGSTDNVGIVSYEWDFGDGTTGTGKTATYTYASQGTYTVTLTVKDAAGNSATDTISVTVLPGGAPPPPPAEAFPIWIIGAAVATIAIVAAATLLLRKRKQA